MALSAFDDKSQPPGTAELIETLGRSGNHWKNLTPCAKHFLVGFVLGEKAVKAAREAGLPADVMKTIAEAPKYAEGRGVTLEVRTKKDLEAVKILAAVKMAN